MKDRKDKILNWLYARQRFGIKPGLSRTLSLLDEAGNPHESLRAVHIAGTNGKGSVAAMVASVLTEAGYKTGLYTSPHLVDFNERIRISSNKITDLELIRLVEKFQGIAEEVNATFFEITTAMAFKHFAQENVDIALVETGMGGRFDSTNVLTPMVSVITRIGMDHAEFLGDSLEKIAFEKAGIIKPGCASVIGPNRDDIREFLVQRAISLLSPYMQVDGNYSYENLQINDDLGIILDINTPENEFHEIELPLGGIHQAENIMTALSVIEQLSFEYDLYEDHIYSGLKNVIKNAGIQSRCQLLSKSPPVILDVSHNPQAISAMVNLILNSPYKNYKFCVLFGAMKDKEIDLMLKELLPVTAGLIPVKPETGRAASTEEIALLAKELGMDTETQYKTPSSAFDFALSSKEPLLITGSFYLAGELMESGKITL